MIGVMDPRFAGYGFSLTGRSHRLKGTECQDSHIFSPCPGRWHLIAVADGLGSAPLSDMGAKTALETLAARCVYLPEDADDDALVSALQEGFAEAFAEVERLAQTVSELRDEPVPVEDFDCTLTACLYDGEKVCIGHVGDGGVIGLDSKGCRHLLTEVQKGEAWNEVTPLRLGVRENRCVFKIAEDPMTALLLVTDGILDQIAPPILAKQPDPLYHKFLSQFISHRLDTDPGELIALLESDACKAISDDMTAAAIWLDGAEAEEPPAEYLAEPDWEAIRAELYKKLYPNLAAKEA